MKILITTQYRENYGTPDEPYWKFKGSEDYFILGVDPLRVAPGTLVEQVRDRLEWSDAMSESWIWDWQLVSDDALSPWEQDQMQYDGEIRSPATVLELEAA
jgi:hypothetical protein